MKGRNSGERFAAPQIPEEIQRQIIASSVHQQNQASYQTPTEVVELPSKGVFYPENHPLYNVDTIEIKMMTTKEEDILTSPSLIEKGVVFDKLLESIILDKRITPSSLLVGDRTAILAKARVSAYGPEYSFLASCPECGTNQKVDHLFDDIKCAKLPLDELQIEDGLIKVTLPKSGMAVHLKLLCGQDEKEIQDEQNRRRKSNLPEENLILMYRKLIVRLNGDENIFNIANFASSMSIMDSRFLRKFYSVIKPDIDMSYTFQCGKCGHIDNGGVVPITGDFFWPKL